MNSICSSKVYEFFQSFVLSFLIDSGAREAADWAIARSLSALVRATEEGKLQDSSTDRLETQVEEEEEEEQEQEQDEV